MSLDAAGYWAGHSFGPITSVTARPTDPCMSAAFFVMGILSSSSDQTNPKIKAAGGDGWDQYSFQA